MDKKYSYFHHLNLPVKKILT